MKNKIFKKIIVTVLFCILITASSVFIPTVFANEAKETQGASGSDGNATMVPTPITDSVHEHTFTIWSSSNPGQCTCGAINSNAFYGCAKYSEYYTTADFWSELLASTGADVNENDILEPEEISLITELDLSGRNFYKIKGLNNLKALKKLDISDNDIYQLDISGLTELEYLDCSNNPYIYITNLSYKYCTDLSPFTQLKYFYADNTGLTGLDLTSNTALVELSISNNFISTLDLSNNTVLKKLDVSKNKLTHLDLTNQTTLESLSATQSFTLYFDGDTYDLAAAGAIIDRISLLTPANVINEGKLPSSLNEVVSYTYDTGCGNFAMSVQFAVHSHNWNTNICSTCGAVRLLADVFPDSSFMLKIREIHGNDDNIITPDEQDAVKEFIFWETFSSCETLEGIQHFPQIERFIMTNLIILSSNTTQSFTADFTGNPELKQLIITARDYSSYDIFNYANFSFYEFSSYKLDEYRIANVKLNITQNTKLTDLILYNLNIGEQTDKNTGIPLVERVDTLFPSEGIDISNISSKMDMSIYPEMKNLRLQSIGLTEIDLTGLKKLETLFLDFNKIEAIDLSDCTKLHTLSINYNELYELDISQCKELFIAKCDRNHLLTINVSENQYLFEAHPDLSSFDQTYWGYFDAPYFSAHYQIYNVDIDNVLLRLDLTELYAGKEEMISNILRFNDAQNLNGDYLDSSCLRYDYQKKLLILGNDDIVTLRMWCQIPISENAYTESFSVRFSLNFIDHEHKYAMEITKELHYELCPCGDEKNRSLHYGGTATCLTRSICDECGAPHGSYSHVFDNHDTPNDDCICTICNALHLCEHNFPDAEFLAYIRNQTLSAEWDEFIKNENLIFDFKEEIYGEDESLSSTEIRYFKIIDLSYKADNGELPAAISSFEGIRHFTELSRFVLIDNQKNIENIDFSDNQKLFYIEIINSKLSSIKLQESFVLTKDAQDAKMFYLLLSQNKLEAIPDIPNDCTQPVMVDISYNNISGNIVSSDIDNKIIFLDVSGNQIPKILLTDTSSQLLCLACNATGLIKVDVSGCKKLCQLMANNNSLTQDNIILSDFSEFNPIYAMVVNQYVYILGNEIDLGIPLIALYFDNNLLTELPSTPLLPPLVVDFDGDPSTTEDIFEMPFAPFFISANENDLTSVDITEDIHVVGLSVKDNKSLSSLKVGAYTFGVICIGCNLTELDFSMAKDIAAIYCADNELTSLNVSGCVELLELNCDNNHLTRLDLSTNTKLSYFSGKGQTAEINVKKTNLTMAEIVELIGCTSSDIPNMMMHTPTLTNISNTDETYANYIVSAFPASIQYQYTCADGMHQNDPESCCMGITLTIKYNGDDKTEISASITLTGGKAFEAFYGADAITVASDNAWSALFTLNSARNEGDDISVNFGQNLPKNTKLILIWLDSGDDKAKFYYYITPDTSVGKIFFSAFSAMGTENHFDCSVSSNNGEKFILVVDYSDADLKESISHSVSFGLIQDNKETTLCTSIVTVTAANTQAELTVEGNEGSLSLPKNEGYYGKTVAIIAEAKSVTDGLPLLLPYNAAPKINDYMQKEIIGEIVGGNRIVFILGEYIENSAQAFIFNNLPEGYNYMYSIVLLNDLEEYNIYKVLYKE